MLTNSNKGIFHHSKNHKSKWEWVSYLKINNSNENVAKYEYIFSKKYVKIKQLIGKKSGTYKIDFSVAAYPCIVPNYSEFFLRLLQIVIFGLYNHKTMVDKRSNFINCRHEWKKVLCIVLENIISQ